MIPAWKIKREIQRFREQLTGHYGRIVGPSRTRRYDRMRATTLRRTGGLVPLGHKVAIFLIYQPDTLPASLLETCKALISEGFSPLIISNAALREEARETLKPLSWRIVERPNIGYDFGGYREGVLQLLENDIQPNETILMNDSVWVVPQFFAAFLTKLRDLGGEMSGAITRSKKGKTWIESYFYLITRDVFASEAFRSFWLSYRLNNSKYVVIREGERDFSVQMAKSGVSLCSLADNESFIAHMKTAPVAALETALRFANGLVPQDRCATLLAQDKTTQAWRDEVLGLFDDVLGEGRVWNSMFPIAGHSELGYPFVKKSLEPLNTSWRLKVLEAAQAGALAGIDATTLAEIEASQAKGSTSQPHWLTHRASK